MFGTELEFKRGEYQDPCSGDSGGPLMHLTPDSDSRRWVIIGWLEYKYKNKCDSMFLGRGCTMVCVVAFLCAPVAVKMCNTLYSAFVACQKYLYVRFSGNFGRIVFFYCCICLFVVFCDLCELP